MSKSSHTIQSFAFLLGDAQRKTREASLPFHKAYVAATPEQQKDLRHRWMRGHIMGSLAINETQSDRILSQSRDDRTEKAQKAYKKASADFSYHVARPETKDATPTQSNRISREHRKAAQAYLALFEDAKSALAVLRAVAK